MAEESQQCTSFENSRDLTFTNSPSVDSELYWQIDGLEMEVRCKDLGGRLIPHSTWPYSTLNLVAARRPIRKPKCKPKALASRKRISKLPRPAIKSQAVGKRGKRPRPACKRQPVARKTRRDIAKAPYEPHTYELHGPFSDSELVISCSVPPLYKEVIIRELQRLGGTHDPQYTGYCLVCSRLLLKQKQEAEQTVKEALQQQEEAALQQQKQQEKAALRQQKEQEEAALQQQKQQEKAAPQQQKQQEKAALRQQKQQEEAALRQQKQQEEAALQQQKQQEEAALRQQKQQEEAALQQQQNDEEEATEKNPEQQIEKEDATKDFQQTEDVLQPEGEPNVFATPSTEQCKLFWYFKKLRN